MIEYQGHLQTWKMLISGDPEQDEYVEGIN
jgi:hypothetical protein